MKTIRTQIRFASFAFYGIFLLCLSTAIASPAQTFTTVHSFDGTDGATPYAGLVQATDGNLYGTTSGGGAYGGGTVFKITPSGKLTTIHDFVGTDGAGPEAGLVQATDGNLYGTTVVGGAYGDGTVFQIAPSGRVTTLHSFDGTDGANPVAELVQATDGNLYGTTFDAGNYSCFLGCGTVFQLTPNRKLTTHLFDGGTDGAWPLAGLVQATDGNLYGVTSWTVFQVTPKSGRLTTLHTFDGTDGEEPTGHLIQATDGDLYGTTYQNGNGTGCVETACGTVFKITTSGKLTTLYIFCEQFPCMDGANPYAWLVQATDGKLYGTTSSGGAYCCGTVFQITPKSGRLTTIHSFDGTDGAIPYAGVVQATDGNLYGTTLEGGALGFGTVFRLSK